MSLGTLREALERAKERTSLRQVAAAVGLTPRGLSQFLRGSAPRASTLGKLHVWYLRHGAEVYALAVEMAAAALAFLLQGIREPARRLAVLNFVSFIEAIHREQETALPAWIESVRRRR
ncbi:MAG TPA: helix-turn-helix domain-containing protein [Longimicrobium sp.]|nr:helix-turn-helix domain-containing protein [Longimicrobium sp.]